MPIWNERLVWIMFGYPFSERTVADRFVVGLLKAGVTDQPTDYLPAFEENRLKGEEIRNLLFGAKIAQNASMESFDIRFEIDFGKDGAFSWRGANSSDSGQSRIDDDTICMQYKTNWWGLEDCATVFRNPFGKAERRNEYFFEGDIGFRSFSLVR